MLAFGQNNRAGINGTLHRVSCLRNQVGAVIGLRFRLGKAIEGSAKLVDDLLRGMHINQPSVVLLTHWLEKVLIHSSIFHGMEYVLPD